MLALYGVAAAALAIDQISKFCALHFLRAGQAVPVVDGVFHLNLVQNTGIAFGFFQGHPAFWTLLITVSVIGLAAGAPLLARYSCSNRSAYGLILGGAAGNWIDRLRVGHVIDFLDFRVWPVFNLADSFITIGVVILVIHSFRGR